MTMPKEANETAADVGLTRFTFATAYALGANMLGPWDVYLPAPSAPRYWGAATDFVDLFEYVRGNAGMFDDAATAIANDAPVNASFVVAHTGANGDGQRFNLPSDTAHPAAGKCVGSASLEACEYQCLSDDACVAAYSDAPNQCCLLHRPLTVIKGTALIGTSLMRRNCSWTATGCGGAPALAVCIDGCAGLSVYPRRGTNHSASTPFVAVHLVVFTARDASASAPAPPTPIALKISNSALFGNAACNAVAFELRAPNRTGAPLAPMSCTNGSSLVHVPQPSPWATIVARPAH